jgi:hypothetical protein
MVCEIEASTLANRTREIQQLLSPLVARRTVLMVEIVERVPLVTLAAYSGGRTPQHHHEWRFNTRVDGIRGGYYERWQPVDSTRRRYCFERGYLHLFRRVGPARESTEKQVLALHCDPNEERDAPHALYKIGPHLHVSAAEPPLNAAHIALNYSHLDEVLGSFERLSVAFSNSITMVNEQVLKLY